MRRTKSIVLSVLLCVPTAWYLYTPLSKPPDTLGLFLELSILKIEASQQGTQVNFTIRLRNKEIWPLTLIDLSWFTYTDGETVPWVNWTRPPESLTFLPHQSIEVPASVWRLKYRIKTLPPHFYPQLEFVRIESVAVSVVGAISVFTRRDVLMLWWY